MRFLLLLAVACSSPPRTGTTEDVSSHVPSGPTTPAPEITWTEGRLEVSLLPAIAHAGEVVVVAHRENDGGRGYPNLAIDVRDRLDKLVQTIKILDSNEYEKLVPDGKTPVPELVTRIADANEQLKTLHGLHRLQPLVELRMGAPTDQPPHLASDSRVDVEWAGSHLRLFPHTRTVPVADRNGTAWLAPDRQTCDGCPICRNEAMLRAVYRSEDAHLVLVLIGYSGTDTCWEPTEQYHVVTW